MQSLPRQLPAGLTLEKPGNNLASLATTPALKAITQTVVQQWQRPDVWRPLARHGIYPVRQMLFYGPPGNGKTSACQWLAMKINVPLYRVRCEAVVDCLMGKTAKNIADVMEWLHESPPAVVLFDEVESLFPSRSSNKGGNLSRETNSAMAVFWQYLDRWTGNHLFILATNLAEALDPALVSRLEVSLEFGPPTREHALAVIGYWAEVLNQYGAEHWAAEMTREAEDGREWRSFRALWQEIRRHVLAHVTKPNG
jgi:SpoVK/Ycf46/Vps4 family AAA+-type ATPase